MTQQEIAVVLTAIEAAVEKATWTLDTLPMPEPVVALAGKLVIGASPEWVFTLISFSIEDQGFPPGSRGAEMTARHTREPWVIRCPRPIAERARVLSDAALAQAAEAVPCASVVDFTADEQAEKEGEE